MSTSLNNFPPKVAYQVSVVDGQTIVDFEPDVDRRTVEVYLLRQGQVYVKSLDPHATVQHEAEEWGGLA